MFTGIVEEIGAVKATTRDSLVIQAGKVLDAMHLGDSISVNGACLTVIKTGNHEFAVELMPETKRLTNLGSLRPGDRINLERALSANGRLGGHFVQGHVDGIGKLVSTEAEGKAVIAGFSAAPDLLHYLVKKCFVAVNGVSLTVIDSSSSQFYVSLVTFTRTNTNLGVLKKGDIINIEVDIIAKYIEKLYNPDKNSKMLHILEKYDYLETR